MSFKTILFLTITKLVLSFNPIDNYITKKSSDVNQSLIQNRASRLGEPVLLECGVKEHQLLNKLESSDPSMPILVNWFKHYSPNRRSDKPIYAKYLANNIDYAPHVSKEFENRIQVVDKINLNITSLKAVDEALYECRLILFDKAYADSLTGSMFYLQVQIAPEFEYPNEEIVYFKPNVPIRLYCYAKGKPIPSITWYKNGKFIETNTSVLQDTISENEIADIFEYKCRAENDVGVIEHTTKVIRSGSLYFTEPLKNLTITEGTILNWPCLAQSNTEINYKWFKDSISVESHLIKWSDRGALFQDGMLYLLETYRTDSGFYECHASTSNKRIITSAFLNILYGPEIEPFPSPLYAFENSKSIIIDCVIKANPSILTLEWFKDQFLLSNTEKYEILSNNSLLIRNPNINDQGNYYCVCNNTIKKTISQHVKVELIEARRFEKISFTTTNNQFSLPCVTKNNIDPNNENVQWFKINSKLPTNRYSIDLNGSLVLNNLRSSDSGFYYCKLKEEFVYNLLNDKQNILIKLFVKKNRTSSDPNTSSEGDAELADLPLCPQNVKLNQTQDGILVSWIYPQQTPVDIEYFQIYFREISDHLFRQTGKPGNKFNYEWKTTEPINFDTYSYLIDDLDLEQGRNYEIQLVSFSSFSKSLPTQNFKIKYQPKHDKIKEFRSSVFAIRPTTSSYIRKFSLDNLKNLSQLDLILAAIFLILICVLIISITACVLFRQSENNTKKQQKGDFDDWGFQSSAVTTTFLSSSSSEKSTSLDSFSHKNKLFRHPQIEYNLNNKSERKYLHNNVNILKNETPNVNQEDDMFDDGDYYYAKPKIQTNTLKSRNLSYQSNSTTTGISSNQIDSSRSGSSTGSTGSNNQKSENYHSPINNSDATSSGITSASVTSSLINSDDNNDDVSEKSNDYLVNKIKYNAKTNILSTEDSGKSSKIYKPARKKHEHVLLEENYSKIIRPGLGKQIKEDCENEYSGLSLDVDTSNSSSGKKYWNRVSPAKSDCSVEINDSQNPVPPFPTSHFKDKLPLDSSSSLTMVSRLPTSSFSYFTNQEAKKILSSESSSSSSSGCSSMTQQVCTKYEVGKFCTLVNDKNLNKSKKKNVNFVNQRNSLCVNMDLNNKYLRPAEKKELIYSTNFKPVLKSINSTGSNLLRDESPKIYHTSTFKPNKIDYV